MGAVGVFEESFIRGGTEMNDDLEVSDDYWFYGIETKGLSVHPKP